MNKKQISVVSHFGNKEIDKLIREIVRKKLSNEVIKDEWYNEDNHTTTIYPEQQKTR